MTREEEIETLQLLKDIRGLLASLVENTRPVRYEMRSTRHENVVDVTNLSTSLVMPRIAIPPRPPGPKISADTEKI